MWISDITSVYRNMTLRRGVLIKLFWYFIDILSRLLRGADRSEWMPRKKCHFLALKVFAYINQSCLLVFHSRSWCSACCPSYDLTAKSFVKTCAPISWIEKTIEKNWLHTFQPGIALTKISWMWTKVDFPWQYVRTCTMFSFKNDTCCSLLLIGSTSWPEDIQEST